MNNLKKILQVPLSILLISLINVNTVQGADLNSLTVTFKNGTNTKYVKLINLFTNTKIKEKISENKYIFTVDKELKNYSVNNYSNLLSIIPEVQSIEPKMSSSLKNKKAGDYVDGLILVRYKDGITNLEINKIDRTYKTKSTLFIKNLSLYKVKLPDTLSVDQAVSVFLKLSEVKYAEPDRIMKIQNKKNFSVIFNDNNNEIYQKIFTDILDNNLTKSNNSYITSFSDEYDSEQLISSLKISPLIMDIKQVK